MKFICWNEDGITGLSPSMRREWIEMCAAIMYAHSYLSPSMRREWIEMDRRRGKRSHRPVSLHAEGVD